LGTTVFIKNINYNTTESTLQAHFEKIGPLRSVTIPKKKEKGELQSMGFGFIEFMNKDDAKKALKSLQNINIDGHTLVLRISKTGTSVAPKEHVKANNTIVQGTKLLIKNVAFETTKKDLKDLFGTFGELKTVRLPKKMDGTHRGFAFVEFLTKQEAKNAMDALKSTHLYGRHLVIEYAKDDANIEAVREKTNRYYSLQQTQHMGKKQKKDDKQEDEPFNF